jgi:integrase/recombinase XerD
MAMKLEDLCDRYLDHLRVERNLSPHTIESYGRDLCGLRRFLAEERQCDTIEAVDHEVLTLWLQDLARQNKAPASQGRALSAARQLCLYALRAHIIFEDPSADLHGPRHRRTLPKVPTAAQAERLFTRPVDDTPQGLRNLAALELLYGAGLRASELCQLRLSDINLASGLVRPQGKGKKERVVPIGEPAVEALQAYLQRGRPALLKGATHEFVFLGHRGRAISRMGLFKIVRRLALAAGLPHPMSPHKLRHAFATHLLQGGADLRAVQEMLGHASIATTEIYTHVAQTELRSTVDLHHPLGKSKDIPQPQAAPPDA